jgi:acyl-CoA synthetase (AMP-forming)/AMP-acid ligase II
VTTAALLDRDFAALDAMIRGWGAERGSAPALADPQTSLSWGELDARVDAIAARLQSAGLERGEAVAIGGLNSVNYAAVLFGVLRAGGVAALLTTSATPQALGEMLADSGARHAFVDAGVGEKLGAPDAVTLIGLEPGAGSIDLEDWTAAAPGPPRPVDLRPEDAFNIIYSSGTTGRPKGIVQSHGMRFEHVRRAHMSGFDATAVALYATPLYSNTTLVSFVAAMAGGGRAILMPKFDARRYCEIAQDQRVTHTILVPVQYRRLMDLPEFDSFDLSAFRYKACTSAPFSAELKAEILRRWPGRLVEFYGMTEGGGSCVLQADQFPHKLHTVGQPAEGHDIRLLDEDGKEVPRGEIGEVVGRSRAMMIGYHGQPEKTAEAEWYDAQGNRFIRHGDLARFDEDGFLVLVGRAKDLIISGGFNIYPSDLEAELLAEPEVADAAVVGAPSATWGETPVAFVVLRDSTVDLEAIRESANARLGKTQRISAIHAIDEMPRSAIGKVLKRELRERLVENTALPISAFPRRHESSSAKRTSDDAATKRT